MKKKMIVLALAALAFAVIAPLSATADSENMTITPGTCEAHPDFLPPPYSCTKQGSGTYDREDPSCGSMLRVYEYDEYRCCTNYFEYRCWTEWRDRDDYCA